jgi:hypothetical protein
MALLVDSMNDSGIDNPADDPMTDDTQNSSNEYKEEQRNI